MFELLIGLSVPALLAFAIIAIVALMKAIEARDMLRRQGERLTELERVGKTNACMAGQVLMPNGERGPGSPGPRTIQFGDARHTWDVAPSGRII
jgi:hypothetical protein